jgi:hypothetical protein
MPLKLKDKNKGIINYRETNHGAILSKGKRDLHIQYKSVNQSNKAKEVIAKNSFDKLFKKGKKVKVLGNNVAYIKIT